MVEGGSPRVDQRAHAGAEQGDAGRVDAGLFVQPVQDLAYWVLPVRPEHEPVAVTCRRLARTVEGDYVVAALSRRGRTEVMHLLRRAVEAVVHHDGRPGAGAAPVEVAVEDCPVVRDRYRLDGRREEAASLSEARDGPFVAVLDPRVAWVRVQEELRAAVVTACPHRAVPRARRAPLLE